LLGQVAVIIGVVTGLIAAWFLWGTSLVAARDQHDLAEQFEQRLESATTAPAAPTPQPATPNVATPARFDDPRIVLANTGPIEAPDLEDLVSERAPELGAPVGRIVIPDLELNWIIVEGTDPEHLSSGPGHVSGSAVPGQIGNTVISGHRTTYGAPFFHLDELQRGDTITVETLIGTHTYEVVETRTILPTDTWVATQWEGSWLTLTTCAPPYYSTHRLIVIAQLIDGPNADAIHAYYGPPIDLPPVSS
jgi:sortase A